MLIYLVHHTTLLHYLPKRACRVWPTPSLLRMTRELFHMSLRVLFCFSC
ncbi:unnamed protein product [Amoebophrya sp. A120]|nr:unnamed protein product [Amoebophrya sp. A120]|eukprot:GSA120T00007125001.1